MLIAIQTTAFKRDVARSIKRGKPIWLLIYRMTAHEVVFERLGTHADLFGL